MYYFILIELSLCLENLSPNTTSSSSSQTRNIDKTSEMITLFNCFPQLIINLLAYLWVQTISTFRIHPFWTLFSCYKGIIIIEILISKKNLIGFSLICIYKNGTSFPTFISFFKENLLPFRLPLLREMFFFEWLQKFFSYPNSCLTNIDVNYIGHIIINKKKPCIINKKNHKKPSIWNKYNL